jgi:hypothetical protein
MANARHDTTCLNCGHTVDLRFCPACGQENVLPDPSLWKRFKSAFWFSGIFEMNFLRAIRSLMLSPGSLTLRYFNGKLASTFDPMRLLFIVTVLYLSTISQLTHITPSKNLPFVAPTPIAFEVKLPSGVSSVNSMAQLEAAKSQIIDASSETEYESLRAAMATEEALKTRASGRYFDRRTAMEEDAGFIAIYVFPFVVLGLHWLFRRSHPRHAHWVFVAHWWSFMGCLYVFNTAFVIPMHWLDIYNRLLQNIVYAWFVGATLGFLWLAFRRAYQLTPWRATGVTVAVVIWWALLMFAGLVIRRVLTL